MKKANNIYDDYDLYEEQTYTFEDDDDADDEEVIEEVVEEPKKKPKKSGGPFDKILRLGPTAIALIAVAALLGVIMFIGGTALRARINTLNSSNTDMMQQLANIRQC